MAPQRIGYLNLKVFFQARAQIAISREMKRNVKILPCVVSNTVNAGTTQIKTNKQTNKHLSVNQGLIQLIRIVILLQGHSAISNIFLGHQ